MAIGYGGISELVASLAISLLGKIGLLLMIILLSSKISNVNVTKLVILNQKNSKSVFMCALKWNIFQNYMHLETVVSQTKVFSLHVLKEFRGLPRCI